ncbi:hypothetical protein [Chitinivibrio alkaliphilus]|nr:hypothetical protein [Chitinivibrio alkaliphilus]
MTILRGLKDTALALGIKGMGKKYLAHIGHITTCEVTTAEKRCALQIALAGEPHPIRLSLSYDLREHRGSSRAEDTLILTQCTASKEWMETVAQNYLCNRSIPLTGSLRHLSVLLR